MSGTKEKKIIFVCTGNTCRSPMAEALLRYELKRLGKTGVTVSSAGTQAANGGGMNPYSLQVLSENGFESVNFQSTQLSDEMILTAHAIVCMTDEQRDVVSYLRYKLLSGEENAENNVYSFADFTGVQIPDPYGQEIEAYRAVFKALLVGMPKVAAAIFPEEKTKQPKAAGERKPRKKTGVGTKKKQTSKKSATKKTTKKTAAKKPAEKKGE